MTGVLFVFKIFPTKVPESFRLQEIPAFAGMIDWLN